MSLPFGSYLHRADEQAVRFAGRAGVPLLRLGLGVVYFWFGFLKLFPAGSPVEDLVVRTVSTMTFDIVTGPAARLTAAGTEILIALVLLSNRLPRITAILLLSHVVLVSAPLVMFPAEMWRAPMMVTLEAQYILKNVVTIGAAVAIAATASVRAARVTRSAPVLPVQRINQDQLTRSLTPAGAEQRNRFTRTDSPGEAVSAWYETYNSFSRLREKRWPR